MASQNLANTEMYKLLATLFKMYEVTAVDPQQPLDLITLGINEYVGPLNVRIARRYV
jgi:hypothetical protein